MTKPLSFAIGVLAVLTGVGWFFSGTGTVSLSAFQNSNPDAGDTPQFPGVFIRDVVVSNTDPTLKNTDMMLNAEPGIAVNHNDPRKIVVSAFSGAWSSLNQPGQFKNAPVWYTTNGGALWTKQFTIPSPPGIPTGAVTESPCDQTFDYGRNGVLYGTFLLNGLGEEGGDCSSVTSTDGSPAEELFAAVISGATSDPSNAQAWKWLVMNGTTQPTNKVSSPDQPWLIVNRDPSTPSRENVYVAYQAASMRVAVAQAAVPPNFTIDNPTGNVSPVFGANPGHRIAADHHSGAVYSLYQNAATLQCPGQAVPVSYMVNRSTDGGLTWELNGQPGGIVAAQACSNQRLFAYAFGEPEPGVLVGGVNSLKGGVDALAVDPNTGSVYVVYGDFDQNAGRDRIAIIRLAPSGKDGMTVGMPSFVSGTQHQSALPGVAVADDKAGTVAVLYDTADGLDPQTGSRPIFSAHLALSQDHGKTFQDTVLQTFLFPENAPNGGFGGPRPLGDFQQLKAVGRVFYGVFSGDGMPFGRPFQKIDPIFFRTSVKESGQ